MMDDLLGFVTIAYIKIKCAAAVDQYGKRMI